MSREVAGRALLGSFEGPSGRGDAEVSRVAREVSSGASGGSARSFEETVEGRNRRGKTERRAELRG